MFFFVWDIKLCPQLTVHNTGISLLLSTSVWVLLSPPIERRETRPRLNVPVHGRCGERRSTKVQPSTRPGLEPGTSWLAVRDLTNCANLAHKIVIELLANAIRSDDNIKGVSVGNWTIKSVIYADDLSATVSDIHSAKRLLELIECFGRFSGLNIKFEKTEALWLGSLRNCKKQPLG